MPVACLGVYFRVDWTCVAHFQTRVFSLALQCWDDRASGWQLSSPPQVGRSFLSSGNTWTTHLGAPDCHVALITNAWSWHRRWHVLQLDDFSFPSYEKCGAVRSLHLDVGQRAKLRGDECGGMREHRLHSSPHHVIKEEAVLVDTFTEILYNLGRLKPSSIVNIALVWLLFSYKWRFFFPAKCILPKGMECTTYFGRP